jgi:GNAT superfamily N-acetyltransferase
MAAGAVSHQMATSSVRRKMPDPIPVMVLARLAVDRRAQGMHLGAAMLQDAVNRAVAVSQNAGVRALLVHALNDRAKQFYEHYGFRASPVHPMTLMLRLASVKP